jgi:hypothetical protein
MGQIFRRVEPYLDNLETGNWVEIGTSANGIDSPTSALAQWSKSYGKHFTTVDVDSDKCAVVRDFNLDIEVVNSTGEDYLRQFPKHIGYISLLYLDGLDWNWHPMAEEGYTLDLKRDYRERFGMEMTNINSQQQHLNQAMLAMPCMAPTSIVVCDHTWFDEHWGHYSGKGGAVIPLLLNNGFRIVYQQPYPVYGVILGRGF